MFKYYNLQADNIIDKLVGEQATIKLASAFNLNDPYELKFNLDLNPKAQEHEEKFYEANPGKTADDFQAWQKHAIEYEGYTWYIEQQQRHNISQSIALCSFTEDNTNNLMWSHYANNHRGICIEYKPELFEYLKTLMGYLAFWKVKYSNEPPVINSLEDLNSKAQKIIFNKQSDWKYEKEHRVVFLSKKDEEYISIDRSYINSVYIGSRADCQVRKNISSLCDDFGINVYQGITLGKSYQVQFQKYKAGTVYSTSFWS